MARAVQDEVESYFWEDVSDDQKGFSSWMGCSSTWLTHVDQRFSEIYSVFAYVGIYTFRP